MTSHFPVHAQPALAQRPAQAASPAGPWQTSTAAALLEVDHLHTIFWTAAGVVRAVDDVSFTIHEGERFGLVGESGSGKSVTASSIMRLIDPPNGEILAGEIIYRGRDLLQLSETEMLRVRGSDIAMIFQDPLTALNPTFTIGDQLVETIRLHRSLGRREAREAALESLAAVQIPFPGRRIHDYPHQFSGGMRQRVVIAMALACNPSLLIADEPTTALDVTTQARILDLVGRLADERGMAVLLITHDLAVVAGFCETIHVMYAGRIVERGRVDELFAEPLHPYTAGLLGCTTRTRRARSDRLPAIAGAPPSLVARPAGCAFHPRCAFAQPRCAEEAPALRGPRADREAACHFVGELPLRELVGASRGPRAEEVPGAGGRERP
jgi:oligopeptide/dipeptide ABC transporter ATP-binding protein